MTTEEKQTVAVGQVWRDEHGDMTVVAVVEEYVVARRYRCMPFVWSLVHFVYHSEYIRG